jgi:hypothetical protein
LEQWAEKVFAKEGVICFDVHVDKGGSIVQDHISQAMAVRKVFEKVKRGK